MIRRLVFVVAFLPFSAYAFLRWIVTGEDALPMLDRFEQWRDQ